LPCVALCCVALEIISGPFFFFFFFFDPQTKSFVLERRKKKVNYCVKGRKGNRKFLSDGKESMSVCLID